MCIPHSVAQTSDSGGRIRRENSKKKTVVYDKELRMKADPNFKDERTHLHDAKEEPKGWLSSLLGK